MDKEAQQILTEISQITRDIEENYPELQKYLKETRDTLPHGDEATLDKESLENYRNTLVELKERYKK
ncbi:MULTISPECIES: hypothetical protein [unclassified Lacinutrix]|uniref:hypothetical protein n=1 Tax=unclassified Lacinutrix TaxID=2647285 RepID=UPI00020A372B|nr:MULTISPECIES: hypothetical protein [unclassified Lacinutrix]AEH00838.1 hypothetical protein Lacal_0990 [Lacinutrix sp. 5H-3-7-4]OIQ23458.1 MAG: hypothetical protein BM549_02520 [Lacinutrix sp. MedPE-SW]